MVEAAANDINHSVRTLSPRLPYVKVKIGVHSSPVIWPPPRLCPRNFRDFIMRME